jgi:hypothetical protein
MTHLDPGRARRTAQFARDAAARPGPQSPPLHRPRPARAAPDSDAAGAPLRPDDRRGVRDRFRRARALHRRRPRVVGHRRLRVRDVRGELGVAELLVVRVGVRHRRLGVPPRHDGADGRRHRAVARPAADVRVDRPRRHARQRRHGRRLRGDARGPAGPVVAGRPAGRGPGAHGARVHGDGRRRTGRLARARRAPAADRDDVRAVRDPARDRDGRSEGRREQGADALASAPHRRALRAPGDHHARRGDHRHRRGAERARARRGRLDGRRRAAHRRRGRPHVRLLVDVLLGAVGRAAGAPPRVASRSATGTC